MDKIPTLFVRDEATKFKRLTHEYAEGLSAERVALLRPTAKFDGSCVKWEGGVLHARYETGWRPLVFPNDKHLIATLETSPPNEGDATYEFCGPTVNQNAHRFSEHRFIRHGMVTLEGVPVDWEGLAVWLATCEYEGVVWWDAMKPVCKVKRKDFGHGWSLPKA
jgi:hypothetical protein